MLFYLNQTTAMNECKGLSHQFFLARFKSFYKRLQILKDMSSDSDL